MNEKLKHYADLSSLVEDTCKKISSRLHLVINAAPREILSKLVLYYLNGDLPSVYYVRFDLLLGRSPRTPSENPLPGPDVK